MHNARRYAFPPGKSFAMNHTNSLNEKVLFSLLFSVISVANLFPKAADQGIALFSAAYLFRRENPAHSPADFPVSSLPVFLPSGVPDLHSQRLPSAA